MRAIHEAAFGRPHEARLVDRLRAVAHPSLSLVAESQDRVVGHVFFSPVAIESERPAPPACGLAPLAVLPERQGEGVGAALVRAGLAECPALGWEVVFLLGSPAYYARFGFAAAAPRGLRYESDAFATAFQVLELRAGALAGVRGRVRYHAEFERLGEP